jgi:hypothetical protein
LVAAVVELAEENPTRLKLSNKDESAKTLHRSSQTDNDTLYGIFP